MEPMQGRTANSIAETSPSMSHESLPAWATAVAVIVPVLVLGLLALRVAYLYTRRLQRLPDLLSAQRKRALGAPRHGRMSIVVTDIQSYSDLMRTAPDDMGQVGHDGRGGESRGGGG